jgi:hypothetical protein
MRLSLRLLLILIKLTIENGKLRMKPYKNIVITKTENCHLSIEICKLTTDPLNEQYHGWSPYQCCVNNSVIFYDVNGID